MRAPSNQNYGRAPVCSCRRGRSRSKMVGAAGFEPTTTSPPDWCATRLRHAPTNPESSTGSYDVGVVAGPTDPPALPARLADRYRLEERIADGGSAEVWLARDTVLDRPVAIKVLHRHLLSDSVMRARLEQEARAAAGLTHPGIVTVHDVDVDEGAAAVVLEFVDGDSLAERIRRDGALPAAEPVRIAAEVAEALDHAHE